MAATPQTEDLFEAGMLLFTQGNYTASIDAFTEVIRQRPNYEPAYLSRGTAYMRTGRMTVAISDFDFAITLDPERDRSYNLRGLAWANLDRHENAIEDYTRALQINPDNAAAQINRTNSQEALQYSQGQTVELPRAADIGMNPFHHSKSAAPDDSADGSTPRHRPSKPQ